ncbi:MAG: DUF2079 domain-containing protein, partial [Planktothrix sp.]
KFIALIPAIPTLLLNILSIDPMQRSLIYQYSLPALPFLFLVMIRTLADEKPGLGNGFWVLWNKFQKNTLSKFSHLFTIPHPKLPQWIVLWSSLIFLLWGDHSQVLGYFTRIDNWSATQNAVAEIQTQGGVLTDNRLAPHFTHRQTIKLLNQVSPD